MKRASLHTKEKSTKKSFSTPSSDIHNTSSSGSERKSLIEPSNSQSILTPTRRSSRQKNHKSRYNLGSFEATDKQKKKVKPNNDFCDSCQGNGKFLCCDSCPRSFHLMCLNPPMDSGNIPEEEWHCHTCRPKKPPKNSIKNGLFGNLVDILSCSNPVSFELPEHIKDCVKGAETNENGDFVDAEQLINPKTKGYPLKTGWTRQLNLTDRKNKIILCSFCHTSGLSGPIISCDYCDFYWHLDCLNPPLAVPPPPHLKWRCPLHCENLIPKTRKLESSLFSRTLEKKMASFDIRNITPLVEKDILSNFFRKISEKRKQERFPSVLKAMQNSLSVQLQDPYNAVLNQYNLQRSFPKVFSLTKSAIELPPLKSILPEVERKTNIQEKTKELFGVAFSDKAIEVGHTDPDLLNFEVSRSLVNRVNALNDLMKQISQDKLLDFFVSNSNAD